MNDAERAVESDCQRLCHAFAYYLDQGLFEPLSNLFADDGVFERNGERLETRAGILAAYAKRPAATTSHLVSNVFIHEIGTDQCRGSSVALVIHALGISSEVLTFDPHKAMRILRFDDYYRLTHEGWRFSYRKPHAVLQSPLWPGP